MKYGRIALALLSLLVAAIGFPTIEPRANSSAPCGVSLRSQTTTERPQGCPMQVPVTVVDQRLAVGEYLMVGNPCTTDPCLPCMVWAVWAGGVYYHLTMHGAWLGGGEPYSWDGYTPAHGDRVAVFGEVSEGEDIFGKTFYNLEVDWLKPAQQVYLPLVAKWAAGE